MSSSPHGLPLKIPTKLLLLRRNSDRFLHFFYSGSRRLSFRQYFPPRNNQSEFD